MSYDLLADKLTNRPSYFSNMTMNYIPVLPWPVLESTDASGHCNASSFG